ncbi:MAG TPA: exodeoxyribonuclease VII small subunit [Candidatus Avimonoglobus intestinipullorum]|uniref:Exodeoxyribonuclease 7 small subunit n=1 Tax=Candidatus Avimonoglobus intestinipullorum TaxID=2840699 RepID=A0A9D1LTI8_9FIRM|nr:exodeoxyribonuclease VII small subunit [Candidatus Avimonoglobus intestinipullorum]
MPKTFEDTIKELEETVQKLEKGDLDLNESLRLFENGIKLSKSCQKMLDDAEKKVSVLLKNETGEMEQKNFLDEEE